MNAFGVNAIVLPPAYATNLPLPRRAGGALLRPLGRVAIEFGDGSEQELEPGGLAWVDAPTHRRLRNLSDSEEAVYVCVGGKDGYVGRDGKLAPGRDPPALAVGRDGRDHGVPAGGSCPRS